MQMNSNHVPQDHKKEVLFILPTKVNLFKQKLSIHASGKPNYKNHVNATLVYSCDSSEQYSRITTAMFIGFIIMNECNIAQNRINNDCGYSTIDNLCQCH